MKGFKATFTAGLLALGWNAALPGVAHAKEVSDTGKGIAGGALLGSEVVLMGEAAFGVEPAWAYILGGAVGAAGGGVGGYFLEKGDNARLSMYLLTGGMALVIPTTIVVLNATVYSQPESLQQDRGTTDDGQVPEEGAQNEPNAAPQRARVATRAHRAAPRLNLPALPPALVGWNEGALSLSVPTLSLHNVFSDQQVADLGVSQGTEYRLSLVNVVF